MSIVWGAWQYSGGNGMRVGIALVGQTPVHASSASVTFTFHVYTQNQGRYADNQTLHWTGALTGSAGFYNSSYGEAVHRQTLTWTYNYPAGQHGVTGSSYLIASISGAYNGVTPSVRLNFTLPPRPSGVPAEPSNISITRTSDLIHQLSWTRNDSNAGPYTSQTILRRHIVGGQRDWSDWTPIATLSGSATSYTVSGLQPNRVYRYGIRANNSAGSSGTSISRPVWNTPGAPVNVQSAVNPGGSTITTTWTPTAYITTPPVGYDLQRAPSPSGPWTTVAESLLGTSFTDSNINTGANVYRVRSWVTGGIGIGSEWSYGNIVSTIVPPRAPSGLIPNGIAWDFNLDQTFTWQHNHGGDGAPQSRYRLEVSSNGGTTWTVLANDVASADSSHLIPAGTLTNGRNYVWRVRTLGVASGGWGPWSTLATVTGSSTPMATITAPKVYITSMPIQVDWIYNQDELSPQAWYRARLLDPDTGQVLEVREDNSPTPSTMFEHMGEDGDRFLIELQVRSAEVVLSPVTSETVEVALPVPALIEVDPEYQECTGTVRLGLTPASPLEAPDDITNLVLNPSFQATAGTVVVDQNLVHNPSFEGEIGSEWTLNGAGNLTQMPTPALFGNNSLRVILGGGEANVSQTVTGLTVGQTYTLSAYFYLAPGAESAAPAVSVDALGNGSTVVISGSWVRSAYTFEATASSHTIRAMTTTGTVTSGQTVYIDGVMLNEGTAPADYFDGDTPGDTEFTYAWAGAQYSSASQRFGALVNRSVLGPYFGGSVAGWRGSDERSQVLRLEERPSNPVVALSAASAILGAEESPIQPPVIPDQGTPGDVMITENDTWSYSYNEGAQPDTWNTTEFDDSTWKQGTAPLGYGQEVTTLIGPAEGTLPVTAYFRKNINIEDTSKLESLELNYLADDGAVVYVNGTEVARTRMAEGPVTYETRAHEAAHNPEMDRVLIPNWMLTEGTNTIAIETHINYRSSPTLVFNASASAIIKSSGMDLATRYTVRVDLEIVGAPAPFSGAVRLHNYHHSLPAGSEVLGRSEKVFSEGSNEIRFVTDTAPTVPGTLRLDLLLDDQENPGDPLAEKVIVRNALIVADSSYDGPYFDGDSPNTSTAIHSWTGTPGDSTSVAEGRAETTVVSAAIQRSINGGLWVTLVRDLPLPNTFIDVVPSTAGLNEYRVIGADAAPSYRTQPIVAVQGTDGDRGGPLWAFLSWGIGFSRILRLRGDLSISETAGRTRGVQAVQGRRLPVLLTGQNRSRGLSVSGTAHYRAECREVGPEDCEHDSPLADWIEAGLEADLVCFRDYTGRRLFGTLGDVEVSEYALGHANVSFPVTATDYAENYGISTPEVI